jgi:O-antigen ligase/Flp pilus assembly protein TadD
MSASGKRARLLPWLLVLPALLFALPFSPIAEDPYPHLAGMGLATVLLVPAALCLLTLRARLGVGHLLVATLAWAALVSRPLAPVSDTLEARRALLALALAPLAFAGGAALDERARALLAWQLVWASLAWTGVATVGGLAGKGWAGVLGDTGSLSQAALAGAAIGVSWLVTAHGTRRGFGALAVALFLAHAVAAPVLAGAHTLLAGLLCAAWRGREKRRTFAALALATLLAPFAGLALREALGEAPAQLEGAPSEPSHSLSGLGVRGFVWKASLGLLAEHPVLGVGPGQFEAAFPPHRDPREIELSRHGTCSELDTEVEHAHNDLLLAFLELGLPGGLFFAAALFLAARAALRAFATEERAPFALAATALLVNALVHAPLSSNPASAPLAFAVLGALGANGEGTRRGAWLGALPLLCAAPFAFPLITHGTILTDYVRSSRRIEELLQRPGNPAREAELASEAARSRATLLAAEAAAPDSAQLALLAARFVPPSERVAAWDRALALRPNSTEAWEQSGIELARAGRATEARTRLEYALALSPTHPRILRNLARLEWTQGDALRGAELLERLRAQGCPADEFTRALGAELALDLGLAGRAARLLFDRELGALDPEVLHAESRASEVSSPEREARECLAQLLWGRAHAAAGNFELALRNYRQAAQRSHASRGSERGPAPSYALELAAAEARSNLSDDARRRASATSASAAAWQELPAWAVEALQALGFPPGK